MDEAVDVQAHFEVLEQVKNVFVLRRVPRKRSFVLEQVLEIVALAERELYLRQLLQRGLFYGPVQVDEVQEERLQGDAARVLRPFLRLRLEHRARVRLQEPQRALHFTQRVPRVQRNILRRDVLLVGAQLQSESEHLVDQVPEV